MNIKSQKGFTGADVTVAVLIVTIFSAIIATLYQNYITTSKEIQRKSEATQYAVEVIENIKQNSDEYFTGENETKERIDVYDNKPIEENTAYSKTVFLEDYSTLGLNQEAMPGYVKKVNVRIAYKMGKDIQSVELSTFISKES